MTDIQSSRSLARNGGAAERVPALNRRQARRWTRNTVEHMVLGVLRVLVIAIMVVITAGPLLYMVMLSLRPLASVLQEPLHFWPHLSEITLEPYKKALGSVAGGGYGVAAFLRNSVIVSVGTVLLCLLLSVLGAYSVARFRYFGSRALRLLFLSIYIFPSVVMAVPLFVFFTRLGLRGSLAVLVVIYVAHTVPVALYMLRNYFESVPLSLEEAAQVDGCGRLRVIAKITLPLAAPSIAATALYVFMVAWNEFLFALLFLAEFRTKWTVSLGVSMLNQQAIGVTVLMAASIVLSLPVLVLFFAAERLLITGLTVGAEKG